MERRAAAEKPPGSSPWIPPTTKRVGPSPVPSLWNENLLGVDLNIIPVLASLAEVAAETVLGKGKEGDSFACGSVREKSEAGESSPKEREFL